MRELFTRKEGGCSEYTTGMWDMKRRETMEAIDGLRGGLFNIDISDIT